MHRPQQRTGYISIGEGREKFVLVIVFRMLVQHYRASLSDNNNLCRHYALLVKLLLVPLKRKEYMYQWRHITAYTLTRTTDGSAMTGTDKDVLAMTTFRRKHGKTQKKKLGACPR